MSRTSTFGIVGGYGATGSAVAAALLKSCHGEILIGGRDLTKGLACAAKFGPRASAVRLDVFDGRSLDDFCSRCSIIVNCAGPVMLLRDRVAGPDVEGVPLYLCRGCLSFPIRCGNEEALRIGVTCILSLLLTVCRTRLKKKRNPTSERMQELARPTVSA